MNKEYKNELDALAKERILKEQILEGHKNRIINELLNSKTPISTIVEAKPQKTFWQKLLSIF